MFQKYEERDENTFHIRWGNLSVGLNWNGQLTPKLSGNVSLVYARNLAKYSFLSDESYEQDKRVSMERMQRAIIRRLMMWVTGWSSVIVRLRVIIFVWVATIFVSFVSSAAYRFAGYKRNGRDCRYLVVGG